jgi:beta-lactamase regulating signal transducer with metallopeptidase domain
MMAIENILGMIGVVGCAIIDTFLIIDLKMELGLEKRLTTNKVDYETACQELEKQRLEQKAKIAKQSENKLP